MPLMVTAVSPAAVPYDGGHELEITGTFTVGQALHVHIGRLGTTEDPLCHSGVAGRGAVCYADSATRLTVYTPVLPTAVALNITVKVTSTSEQVTLSGELSAIVPSYYLATYSLRRVLPTKWKTGPRSLDQMPALL